MKFDKNKTVPIQMICSISTSGSITPMRFRFIDEEGEKISIDVEDVLRMEITSLTLFILVSGYCYNELRHFQLSMQRTTCKWSLVGIS